jgi:hypothetical protein
VAKSRDALIDPVFDGPTNVAERNIDSHIKRQRNDFIASDSEFDRFVSLWLPFKVRVACEQFGRTNRREHQEALRSVCLQ